MKHNECRAEITISFTKNKVNNSYFKQLNKLC